ncbi:hypothetical protein EC957_008887 [Mortierella hygrophila]|uniref:Uncharacterized protein n=1 Tax=Mortierella hygrophila TaxID=979708 RepID=A0A9P6JXX2_9FUNG|nr:hypothetical protein EC957_008887 [Mortierella hygrophila]
MVHKPSCSFKECLHGYHVKSTIKKQKDHNIRYHLLIVETIGIAGAVFTFRRDPSRDFKYTCVCGAAFPNPFTLRYHVLGKPEPKSKPSKPPTPCRYICRKATDIIANNLVQHDVTKPINYYPSSAKSTREDTDVETMSVAEILSDVETMSAAENLSDVETMPAAETMSAAENLSDVETMPAAENLSDVETMSEMDVAPDKSLRSECDPHDHDIHRILEDNALALDAAIMTLQKTRSDVQKLLQSIHK